MRREFHGRQPDRAQRALCSTNTADEVDGPPCLWPEAAGTQSHPVSSGGPVAGLAPSNQPLQRPPINKVVGPLPSPSCEMKRRPVIVRLPSSDMTLTVIYDLPGDSRSLKRVDMTPSCYTFWSFYVYLTARDSPPSPPPPPPPPF